MFKAGRLAAAAARLYSAQRRGPYLPHRVTTFDVFD
jgi:hypothetical protein